MEVSRGGRGCSIVFYGLVLVLCFSGVNLVLDGLERSLYAPACHSYGQIVVGFRPPVEGAAASQVIRPPFGTKFLLAAADTHVQFNPGGMTTRAVITPEPPTTRSQYRRYIAHLRRSGATTISGEGCSPRFDDQGQIRRRNAGFVSFLLRYWWIPVLGISRIGFALRKRFRLRAERPPVPGSEDVPTVVELRARPPQPGGRPGAS